MRTSVMDGCCGIAEIYNLDELEFNDDYTSTERIVEKLQQQEDDTDETLLIASTIGSQKNAIDALRKQKWTPTLAFKNSNSGNTVTLWVKNRSPKALPVSARPAVKRASARKRPTSRAQVAA